MTRRSQKMFFSEEVNGESKSHTFIGGDLVVVDPSCGTFISNKVYIFSY